MTIIRFPTECYGWKWKEYIKSVWKRSTINSFLKWNTELKSLSTTISYHFIFAGQNFISKKRSKFIIEKIKIISQSEDEDCKITENKTNFISY